MDQQNKANTLPDNRNSEYMRNLGKNTCFTSERQPVSNGRVKGSKNASTIAKMVLNMPAKLIDKDSQFTEIKDNDGNTIQVDTETAITLKQAQKALKDGDTYAYNSLMDRLYGKAKQAIDINENQAPTIDMRAIYAKCTEEELTILRQAEQIVNKYKNGDIQEAEVIPV